MTGPDVLPPDSPAVRWRAELLTGGYVAVLVMLSGAAAGLIWTSLAPKMSIPRLVAQSDAVFRAEVGADAWFLIVTLLAGAIAAVVVCWLFGEVGPGAALGLGVGGICASLVADRVGFLAERASTTTALQAFGLHPGGSVLAEIDFRVRAVGVLTAWPLSSMLVLGLAVAFDAWRR